MTADEARKLNAEHIQTLHLSETEIDKKIETAARAGKTSVYLNLMNIDHNLRTMAYENLKKVYTEHPKKFTVKRESYNGDSREPGSDGIIVSW